MTLGKFSIGKRVYGTHKFKFFYCPLSKGIGRQYYHFFFWVGRRWYVSLSK